MWRCFTVTEMVVVVVYTAVITQFLKSFNQSTCCIKFCCFAVIQRYFVNDTYFQIGGPVFLMIGGEGTADPVWMVAGQWINYARKYGALCLMLEHRYYGLSHPTPWACFMKVLFLINSCCWITGTHICNCTCIFWLQLYLALHTYSIFATVCKLTWLMRSNF